MKIPYILTEKSVAVVIDGKALTMESEQSILEQGHRSLEQRRV